MKIELNSIFNFYKINYDLHLKRKKNAKRDHSQCLHILCMTSLTGRLMSERCINFVSFFVYARLAFQT